MLVDIVGIHFVLLASFYQVSLYFFNFDQVKNSSLKDHDLKNSTKVCDEKSLILPRIQYIIFKKRMKGTNWKISYFKTIKQIYNASCIPLKWSQKELFKENKKDFLKYKFIRLNFLDDRVIMWDHTRHVLYSIPLGIK